MRGKVTALFIFHQTRPYNAEAALEKRAILRARRREPKQAVAGVLISRNTVGFRSSDPQLKI
jgi:hypothetical protein